MKFSEFLDSLLHKNEGFGVGSKIAQKEPNYLGSSAFKKAPDSFKKRPNGAKSPLLVTLLRNDIIWGGAALHNVNVCAYRPCCLRFDSRAYPKVFAEVKYWLVEKQVLRKR